MIAKNLTLRGSRPAACASPRMPSTSRRTMSGRCPENEHAFCVAAGERSAGGRCSGLIEHRRALARRLAKKNSGNRIVAALVADGMHLRRIGIRAGYAIVNDGVVLPATLPELVHDLHE